MAEIKVDDKDTPKSFLRDKVVEVIYDALMHLCGTHPFEACMLQKVKSKGCMEINVYGTKFSMDYPWCSVEVFEENVNCIGIEVRDYASNVDSPTYFASTSKWIAAIFTNENPFWGKIIPIKKCSQFSKKAMLVVKATIAALRNGKWLNDTGQHTILWRSWDPLEPKPEPDEDPKSTPELTPKNAKMSAEDQKSLKDKIIGNVYNALTNLCKSNDAWLGCTVKAKLKSISENDVFIKIIDDEILLSWCAFQISENPEHISIRVLDYSNSASDKPSLLPNPDMEIAKIFTNEDPIRGEMITLDKCVALSGEALWAVRSIMNAFDITRQRTPELNITWYKLGESESTTSTDDITPNEVKDDELPYLLQHLLDISEKAVWHDLCTEAPRYDMELLEEKEIIKRKHGPERNILKSYKVTIDDQYRRPYKYDIDISLSYWHEKEWNNKFQISFFATPEDKMRWQSLITILPTSKLVKIVRHRRSASFDSRSFIVMERIFETLRDKLIEEYSEYNICVEDDAKAALIKIPGGENIEYPTSATLRFEKGLPVQRCPNMLCEFDMAVTEVQDDVITYRCPKCGIRISRTLEDVIKGKDTDKDIPSYHVEFPDVKAQFWPNLTWDHVIMPSHRAENNKEENKMKENKKCVIKRDRLISIVQTFLNNTSEHGPWKDKPRTIETGDLVWCGTKQSGMYFPIIGITVIDPSDDNTGFEIWNTCNGNRDNINIHIDHEGIRFIESSDFNDFGYEFIHNLYEFIKDNLDESKIKNQIENVIFSNPATTVIWTDGTKTTVQTQVLEYTTITKADGTVVKKPKKRVPFDPEAALAACIMNKLFGSHSAYAKYVNGYVVKSEANKAKTKKKVKKEKEPTLPKKPTKKPNTKARKVTIEGGKK